MSAPHFLSKAIKLFGAVKKKKTLLLKIRIFLIDSVNDIMILMIDTDDKNYWFKQWFGFKESCVTLWNGKAITWTYM